MKLADKGLNPQAEAIEEAQTLIRIIVRNGWLSNKRKQDINVELQHAIREALKRIEIPDLRDAAERSLNTFAERQYNTYLREFGAISTAVAALVVLANNEPNTPQFKRAERTIKRNGNFAIETSARGVPLQKFSQDYIRENVTPILNRLASENGLDPDDVSGRNSLRNLSEMEVRYNTHLKEIESFRASGTKLVVASSHADCSDRCSEWQGRVYSLDGTSGATDDGKQYVPLETATDVYYTTKAGKTYKNGLLGFNCRHYLSPYKPGMVIPYVSKETQQRENKINTKQRELERKVRFYKTRAVMNKDIDREIYLDARRKAIAANKEYIQFSKDNGRAYYPSRTKLL